MLPRGELRFSRVAWHVRVKEASREYCRLHNHSDDLMTVMGGGCFYIFSSWAPCKAPQIVAPSRKN